jgi:hypothetical protein
VVLDELPTGAPFPFEWYAAIASARDKLGPLHVYCGELHYGLWWDLLRPSVELARTGTPPCGVERLPLDAIWLESGTLVRSGEAGWGEALECYRLNPESVRSSNIPVGIALADAAPEPRPLAERAPLPPRVPEATPRGEHRRLCIALATFDDFDGVWSTVQAARLYHPEVMDKTNFLILDNHPESPTATYLKDLDQKVPQLRYVPFCGYRGTAVRDLLFREADADLVLCVDSHILLAPGALAALIAWFDDHPTSCDLLQGPLLTDDLETIYASHFEATWGAGMYGRWAYDELATDPGGEPFEIEMQGLGLFACRREAWVGLNPRLRGFGGEEGYLHEKFRRGGGRVLCHPALGWTHRFGRPAGIPYANIWEDRVRNYLIGWSELGWDTSAVASHFRQLLDRQTADMILAQTRRQLGSPFTYFDAIFCLNLDEEAERWDEMTRRFARLDIGWRVERVPAVATPENHHIGCALSYRRMIVQARKRGYHNVLIVEDDAIFLDATVEVMRTAIAELSERQWDLLYLGGAVWSQTFPFADDSTSLQIPQGVTTTHAVAVNETAFDLILADLPEEGDPAFAAWIDTHLAIDQYLASRARSGALRPLIVSPRVATQPSLRGASDADLALADRYVI